MSLDATRRGPYHPSHTSLLPSTLSILTKPSFYSSFISHLFSATERMATLRPLNSPTPPSSRSASLVSSQRLLPSSSSARKKFPPKKISLQSPRYWNVLNTTQDENFAKSGHHLGVVAANRVLELYIFLLEVLNGELKLALKDRYQRFWNDVRLILPIEQLGWQFLPNRGIVKAKQRDIAGVAAATASPPESPTPLKKLKDELLQSTATCFDTNRNESTVSITVVGASGDLAKKKIFPALFALYYEDCLPKHFTVFGYARSKMTDAELRNMVSRTLTCRIDKRENCSEKMEQFLNRCFYHSGQYDSAQNFAELDMKLKIHEGGRVSNRLFYLSIPPNIFIDVVRCTSTSASSSNGWTRVIVEKPFGRDSESSAALTRDLKQYLVEDQIFRIDHYLGKELVENLSVLRFSNLIFEPLWSRQYIRNVQFIFSEDFGTEGRGGYFDNYGIIRDIMQNHLLQILALFAMETPVSLDAEDIRNEKVKVLRSMKPLQLENVVVGQYKSHTKGGVTYPAYTDDKTVPKGSLTPTFAAAALFINNARWDGVPFLMKAGKALHSKRAEIRVQFRHVPGNLYNRSFGTDLDLATNELVIRVQPDEAIYLKINNKVPGLGMRLDRSNLNLHYAARYSKEIPDAYERLLLDAIEGERRLFIRSDELDAAWSLFTPLLKELEERKVMPEFYPYGSRGPVGAHYLAAKYKVKWGDTTADHS